MSSISNPSGSGGGGGAPTGPAGGDLTGTYPDPTVAALAITDAKVAAGAAIAESKLALASDAAAGTASRRTVGTGALQATAGNDARLSDARTPTAHKTSHATGGSDVLSASDIGLGNVNNTSDANKPVSTAQAAADALNLLVDYAPLASHQTLQCWNYPPMYSSSGQVPAAGVPRYARVWVPVTVSFTTIWVTIETAGTGVTPLANCYLGLFNSAGTRLGVTADQSTPWATSGAKSAALTVDGGQSLTVTGGAGVYVWCGILVGTQSTVTVAVGRPPGSSASGNLGLSGANLLAGTTGSALSALPTSFTPSGLAIATIHWAGLS